MGSAVHCRRLGLAGLTLLLTGLFLVHLLRPVLPGSEDPVRLLGRGDGPVAALLRGTLLEDPRAVLLPRTAEGLAAAGLATGSTAAASTPAASTPAASTPRVSIPATAAPACRVLMQTAGGRTELQFEPCPSLRQGWLLRVSGSLRRPLPAPHPLLAGPAERLARQQSWSRLKVEEFQVLERPPTPVLDLRRSIAARLIDAAGPQRGGLLAALVLGSAVVPLPLELREAFRAAGLSHALAASGFHLTVLLGLVSALARPLGRPLRLLLAGGAMLLFLLLAGAQGSVVRAVLMGAAALLALEFGQKTRPLGLLAAVVVVMLALNRLWLVDVGFQLSVAATAGLLVSATPLEQRLRTWLAAGTSGIKERWAGTLAAALAVPIAATIWTLPLQLLHFGVVPAYAVPANLAAAPLLTPLTLAAMALALVAVLVPGLLPPLLVAVNPLAQLLLTMARGFAGLPLAQWQLGRPMPLLVALFALTLLGLILPGLARQWRRLAWAGLALVVISHLLLLGADQVLLVHQGGPSGGRSLLIARHQGRAALIGNRGDPYSCRQVSQLATGLGVSRFDWLLLLDPVASSDPACWQRLAPVVLAYGDDSLPLAAGERLASPGLEVQALSMGSHGLTLRVGRRQWLLLPDRQALWTWRQSGSRRPEAVWLGFRPGPQDRRELLAAGPPPRWLWWSGPAGAGPIRPGAWQATGISGSLLAYGG
ncbi:MAG: ComEC/Rec2 family competence protein [Cyanobium sp.]